MSGSYSNVVMMGNLTRDPEIRFLTSGKALVSFTLALNKSWKDAEGKWVKKVSFIECKLWGKRGESFGKFHQKGALAMVFGEIEQETWEDKTTGKKRSKVFVNCRGWEFTSSALGRRAGQEGGARQDNRPQHAPTMVPDREPEPYDETPF